MDHGYHGGKFDPTWGLDAALEQLLNYSYLKVGARVQLLINIMNPPFETLGFTALTEKYSKLQATDDGTSGTDKLSATLNAYIGKIVHGKRFTFWSNDKRTFFEMLVAVVLYSVSYVAFYHALHQRSFRKQINHMQLCCVIYGQPGLRSVPSLQKQ